MFDKIAILIAGIAAGGAAMHGLGDASRAAQDPHHADTATDSHHHDHDHAHPQMIDLPGDTAPTVRLTVLPDAGAGWNLHAETTRFVFAPGDSGRDHVPGRGHAHLYVNGEKKARIYGNWFHLDELPPGPATLTVGLYSNDHRGLSVAGVAIADSVTIDPPN